MTCCAVIKCLTTRISPTSSAEAASEFPGYTWQVRVAVVRGGLLPMRLTFDNCDVAIEGEIGEALHEAAGLRPFDFEPVEFLAFA